MIGALRNHKGGVGKSALALHLAGAWPTSGDRVVVICGNPQGSALDCSEPCTKEAWPRLIGIVGLAFALRPSRPDTWARTPELPPDNDAKAVLFTARLAIDVILALGGRIKVAVFVRAETVPYTLSDLLPREFPASAGDDA
jgi:chromosome partitioning protein